MRTGLRAAQDTLLTRHPQQTAAAAAATRRLDSEKTV